MRSTVRHDGILSYGYGIVPLMVLVDNRLNDGDRTVYGLLANHARGFDKPARPLQSSMAKMLGVEVPTISLHTTKLQECGYIEKIKGKGGRVEYLMKMNNKTPIQGEMFPEIIRKRKAKGGRPGKKKEKSELVKSYERLETLYFELFMGHKTNRNKKAPEYSYSKWRALYKRYIPKYGEETITGMLVAFFKKKYASDRGFGLQIFVYLANELLLDVEKGKGGKGYDGFKRASEAAAKR